MNPLEALWLTGTVLVSTLFPSVLTADPVVQPTRTVVQQRPAAVFPVKQEGAVEPVIGAKSALLIDLPSQEILYAKEPERAQPIASLTKLMTALLVAERAQPDELVTVPPEVSTVTVDDARMGLQPGEQLRVEDLLAGLLIPSANDAAIALADHVGGSQDGFAKLMNERAAALGMDHTHYANASGLDAEGGYSTAHDLAIVARAAIAQERISGLVGQKEVAVQAVGGRPFTLRSTNALLGSYLPIAGLKTGTTDAAGECLIEVLNSPDRQLMAIVLDSPNRFQETKSMLDWSLRAYQW